MNLHEPFEGIFGGNHGLIPAQVWDGMSNLIAPDWEALLKIKARMSGCWISHETTSDWVMLKG